MPRGSQSSTQVPHHVRCHQSVVVSCKRPQSALKLKLMNNGMSERSEINSVVQGYDYRIYKQIPSTGELSNRRRTRRGGFSASIVSTFVRISSRPLRANVDLWRGFLRRLRRACSCTAVRALGVPPVLSGTRQRRRCCCCCCCCCCLSRAVVCYVLPVTCAHKLSGSWLFASG